MLETMSNSVYADCEYADCETIPVPSLSQVYRLYTVGVPKKSLILYSACYIWWQRCSSGGRYFANPRSVYGRYHEIRQLLHFDSIELDHEWRGQRAKS